MPQYDELTFLADRNIVLQKHIFYVYQKGSGAYRGATIAKVRTIKAEEGAFLSFGISNGKLSSSINYGGLLSLISTSRYILFDLSREKQTEQMDQDIEKTLAIIAGAEDTVAGLILIIPSKAWEAQAGPVWFGKTWPSWSSAAAKATVVLEPMVSVETTAAIVQRMMAFSQIFDFARLANQNAFNDYFLRFVEQESPNLLQLVHRIEYASLVAVDRESGKFDTNVLAEQENEEARFRAVGTSLKALLQKPNPATLLTLTLALDERINRRELKVRQLMKQLFQATQIYIKSNTFDKNNNAIYWAWLLLSSEGLLVTSKAPVVVCDTLLHQYLSFLKRGAEVDHMLSLNAVTKPLHSIDDREPDDFDSLDKGRRELASAMQQWAQVRAQVSLPAWATCLRDALLF